MTLLTYSTAAWAAETATTTAAVTRLATSFQSGDPWQPAWDIQTDSAMVYGVNDTLPARIDSYKRNGYRIELMTGVAWGGYEDYVEGRFDGQKHQDEGQMRRDGTVIRHGAGEGFYFVPTPSYRNYLKTLLGRAIDLGVEGLYLEEPEYWASAGYSEGFKREWKRHYGVDWTPPHTSVDSRYKTARLMQTLYTETLDELFTFAKDHARKQGREVKCYVPTHSLINYSQWKIVSPEASLMALKNADGYIAQVWTGTARTPNYFRGELRERTFETAFLEYAQMVSMVRPSGRVCYLLADPVEDNPNFGWDDYEANYKRVLVASLLQPDESHYEVMPWPSRIFQGWYYPTNEDARKHKSDPPPQKEGDHGGRIQMPPDYATTLLACINSLTEMKAAPKEIKWDSGARRVGVLISDTLMFQRDVPTPSDPQLSSFFGLALPLLKSGMPVKVIQLETLTDANALKDVDVLVMTYEGMKPAKPEYHDVLTKWVTEQGKGLILVDDGKDPYNKVEEWWNRAPLKYDTPYLDLASRMGIKNLSIEGAGIPGATSYTHHVGEGFVAYMPDSPARLAHIAKGGDIVRGEVDLMLERLKSPGAGKTQSNLALRRGRYVIGANMEESATSQTVRVPGRLASLFAPGLPVAVNPELPVGQVGLWVDLDKCPIPGVVASASRVREVQAGKHSLAFTSRGPAETNCATRLRLPGKPAKVEVKTPDEPAQACEVVWDEASGTALLKYRNLAAPLNVRVEW